MCPSSPEFSETRPGKGRLRVNTQRSLQSPPGPTPLCRQVASSPHCSPHSPRQSPSVPSRPEQEGGTDGRRDRALCQPPPAVALEITLRLVLLQCLEYLGGGQPGPSCSPLWCRVPVAGGLCLQGGETQTPKTLELQDLRREAQLLIIQIGKLRLGRAKGLPKVAKNQAEKPSFLTTSGFWGTPQGDRGSGQLDTPLPLTSPLSRFYMIIFCL